MRTEKKWIALSSLMLALAPAGTSQESLSERFPSDAILYAEIDTKKLVEGTLSLDLARLLDEAQVQEFLAPLAPNLPAPISTQGLRQLIDTVPWRQFVDGKVQLAVRGLRVTVEGQSFDVAPSQPISAKQMNRLVGLGASMAEREEPPEVSIEVDGVFVVDAGESFGDSPENARLVQLFFFNTALGRGRIG